MNNVTKHDFWTSQPTVFLFDLQGRVVQSWVKITQFEIWIQIWKLKAQIQFNSICQQFDNWLL